MSQIPDQFFCFVLFKSVLKPFVFSVLLCLQDELTCLLIVTIIHLIMINLIKFLKLNRTGVTVFIR